MRPIKTLKPSDLIIRGLFLSVVVIGGIVGRMQQTEAAPETAVSTPAVEAGMGLGLAQPVPAQCSPTGASAGAIGSRPEAQARGGRQVLSGSVRSSAGCAPIGGARIEFWPAGMRAAESGAQHTTSWADADGHYRLQCELPPADAAGAGYMYLRISADGYATLISKYTPRSNQAEDEFDIVLQPGK